VCNVLFQPLSEDDFAAIFACSSVIDQQEVGVVVVEYRVVGTRGRYTVVWYYHLDQRMVTNMMMNIIMKVMIRKRNVNAEPSKTIINTMKLQRNPI